jgi:hypothetical protein
VRPKFRLQNSPVKEALDKKAKQSLWNNSQYFIGLLGKPREEGDRLVFSSKDLPFVDFNIRYDIQKKFLGKIYAMVLEGKFVWQKMFNTSKKIELRCSGFFKKGRPFFVAVPSKKREDNGDVVLQLLNQEESLIESCWKSDLEFLKIFFDPQNKIGIIQVRPYGGSFIHLLFPPMRYNVVLVKNQAELILSIMKNIAQVIIKGRI